MPSSEAFRAPMAHVPFMSPLKLAAVGHSLFLLLRIMNLLSTCLIFTLSVPCSELRPSWSLCFCGMTLSFHNILKYTWSWLNADKIAPFTA